MTTQTMLFPDPPEMVIQRIDSQINQLLMGHAGGTLGLALDADQKAVLRCIRYMRGLGNAIGIAEIQLKTQLSPRAIKKAVHELRRLYFLPIGSSKRASHGGYYLMISKADRDAWVGEVVDQMRAEAAVVRAIAGPQAALEMLGQLTLEAQP